MGSGRRSKNAALQADPAWSHTVLPGRARIATFLQAEGYTGRYLRHSLLPRPTRSGGHDTTYGTVENIVALEDMGIRAYLPLPDFDDRSDYWARRHRSHLRSDCGRGSRRKLVCAHVCAHEFTGRAVPERLIPDCSVLHEKLSHSCRAQSPEAV